MKLVGDDPLFGFIFEHDLELHNLLEKIFAFLIVGTFVDTAPGFPLVHGDKIHKYACYDVDNMAGKFTFTP